ncbi:MAG: hypothetical protein VCA73_20300 [Roseibacillus sp.]|jgi:hypothetical protein
MKLILLVLAKPLLGLTAAGTFYGTAPGIVVEHGEAAAAFDAGDGAELKVEIVPARRLEEAVPEPVAPEEAKKEGHPEE